MSGNKCLFCHRVGNQAVMWKTRDMCMSCFRVMQANPVLTNK